ncbi:GerAB/ArcD/ProY family transporter [Metabacillus litoralis]|uniref:GerAB/ArcD/ProY family transporter n=1 Tax=Metabacillus litoralis TaxID=152268 RepID=UPI00203FE57E|nr:GerAB/ArcD/ProY family transporter [Metabacillus litoralis]MCM3652340.1 spore germination protein [Metabacillus litoralis]
MLGKYLGWMIGLLYVISLIYIATRTLRSYGDLLLSSTMPKTHHCWLSILRTTIFKLAI